MPQAWSGNKKNYVSKARRRKAATKAGPVTITKADGTVTVKPAYKPGMVHHIVDPQHYDIKGRRLSRQRYE